MALSNAERQRRYRARRRREVADLRAGGASPLGRGAAATRARVREALATLSGLEPAPAVARYFDGTDEAILIDERLAPALAWLTAFAAEFRKPAF